jgi:hypothetical protein
MNTHFKNTVSSVITQTLTHSMKKIVLSGALLLGAFMSFAQTATLKAKVAQKAQALESKVVTWRRDFHQNPELSNREFKTSEKVAAHLRSLGIEVQTGVAKTGVVGILKGGKLYLWLLCAPIWMLYL